MSSEAHEQEAVQEVYQREVAAPDRAPSKPQTHYAAAEEVASAVGNRGFSQMISRMGEGEGILPGGKVHPNVEAAINMASGGGRPLADHARETMESGFGTSFDQVRIHTGPEAQALSRAVSARAFTVGNDIFFNKGEFQPNTPGGQELLRHELAHTIQQAGAPRLPGLKVSMPGDALEVEADTAARDARA